MSSDPKDPRFRPFRAASWALYLVVAVGFSSLIIVSVYRSVLAMTPDHPEGITERYGEAECLERSRALFSELEAQRRGLADGAEPRKADQRFLRFRVQWLERKADLDVRCEPKERPRVRAVLASLDRLMDLYTTSSVQFTGTTAPTLESLRRELDPPRD